MVTREQLQNAKDLLDEVRHSVALAHENWALFVKSKDELFKSMVIAGIPGKRTLDEFQKIIDEHHERHVAALKHYDVTTVAYVKLLDEFNSMYADKG